MHRVKPQLSKMFLLLLYIGIFPCALNAAVEEPDADSLAQRHMVFVEPDYISSTMIEGEFVLEPYAVRRRKWGILVGVAYDSYEPLYYQPNFAKGNYGKVYGPPTQPTIDIQIAVKRNFSLGSIGVEVAASIFKNDHSDPAFVNSILSLTPIRVGISYYADVLFTEPTFVPYGSLGAYTILYHESMGGNSFNGNSQVAPFVNAGCAVQLDRMNRHAQKKSFRETGLQATYVFLEARKYFSAANKKDPDFGNEVSGAAGLRVEF